MGILNEIKKNKTRKIWKYLTVFILFIVIIIIYLIFFRQNNSTNISKTYTVSQKDITSTFSADGNVKYRQQYDINFPISGTLAKIYKNEGDTVKKGDLIASLDDTYLKINLDKANLALANANANLDSKISTKSSDLNVSEKQLDSDIISLEANIRQGKADLENASKTLSGAIIDLENTKISIQKDLENAKNNIQTKQNDLENAKNSLININEQENLNVKNALEKGINEIDSNLPFLEKYLRDVDLIIGVTNSNKNYNDIFEFYLGAKNSFTKTQAEKSFNISNTDFKSFQLKWSQFKANPILNDTREYLNQLEALLDEINDTLLKTRDVLRSSIVSSNFTQANLDSLISSIESDISSLQNEKKNIINSNQNISLTLNSLNTKVLNQNDNIKSFEIQLQIANTNLEKVQIASKSTIDDLTVKVSLAQNAFDSAKIKLNNNTRLAQSKIDISQANLDLKKSNFDDKELRPFYIAIETAKKGVEEAQKQLDDSRLVSPIDGKIGKLSIIKIGTIINTNPNSPFVTVIDKTSLYVETKIEEGDISKIYLGQKVKILFNSLENVEITGRVSYISDKSEADINNIISYKVEIFLETTNEQVKEGFTAQLYFVLEIHRNVLATPLEAVKEENSKSHVILNGKKQEVTTGINDGDYVEILSGLKKGDVISY